MNIKINQFDAMANKDIVHYFNFINTKNTNDTIYNVCAAVNPYSVYDIIQFKRTKTTNDYSYIELKGRRVDFDAFDDCLVEEAKIDKLLKLSKLTGKDAFVVALYYNSDKIAIWKLNNEFYETCKKICNNYTAIDAPKKIMKDMVKLPLNQAKVFNYNYNIENQ